MPTRAERVFSIFGEVSIDHEAALQGLAQVEDQSVRTARSLGDSLRDTGQQIEGVGRQITMATAPLAALHGASIAIASGFEESMQRVRAITNATDEDFARLEATARELGATTRFSATEAAEGLTFLAMAGFDVNESLEALPGILDLAVAGSLDLGRAADIVTNILAGYRMEANEVGRVNDILAETARSANTDIEQMAQAMVTLGPVASGAGVSIEETAAAVGLLADAGIKGGRAGTGLARAMAELMAPTGRAAELIEELSINATDSAGNLLPLAEIIEQMEESGIRTSQVMEMFGQRAGPQMVALLARGSDALRDFSGQLERSEGATSEMVEIMEQGARPALRELRSAFQELAIAIAQSGTLEQFTSFVRRLTEIVRAVAALDPELLRLATRFAGITIAAGPVLIILGRLLQLTAFLTTPFGALTALFRLVA